MPEPRKIIGFLMGDDALFEWFQKNGLIPNGSSLVGVHRDSLRRGFCFMVQNQKFQPVHEGCEVPLKKLEYK